MKAKSIGLKLIFGFILFMMLIIFAACNGETGGTEDDSTDVNEANGEVQEGGEISVRITSDPDFLDPHMAEASITEQMILNLFEGLLTANNDGSLEPGLAEDYDVSDDGMTYTFYIREGVTFHNGDPLTVEDIQYTFERLTGLGGDDPLTSEFDYIESMETPDENTFVFHLEEPNSSFLAFLTALNSAIIPKSNDGNHNDYPIGTGPFQFESYSPGADMVILKNEDYWKEGIPYLDQVTFRFQADNQSALMSMRAGELDLMDVEPHRIPEIEDEFNVMLEPANSTLIIGFNHDREPFDDLKVRQAINFAIDKDAMIDMAFSGYAEKLGSNMSPAMELFHQEGLDEVYDRDVEQARQLLEEAGYPDGFSTTLSISSHNSMYTDIAQVAVENLREIGIDVEIEVIEWGVWLERIYQGRDYEMTAIDFTGKLDPHNILRRYISDYGSNFLNYKNEKYDQLLSDVLLEDEEEVRAEMYKQAQEILTEEAAGVYVLDYQFVWILNPELDGYQHYPFFFHDLSEVRFTE
ncbi:ABC transporter substrate-binding protein [Virgibacillus kimchii]